MVKDALGLIETIGLVAAVEAADAAVKAANIELLGYELTRGSGLVVVKLQGDVGAIKAAVAAGAVAAEKVGKVWATHVIPRPHRELGSMVESPDTVGRKTKEAQPAAADSGAAEPPEGGEGEPQGPADTAGEEPVQADAGEEEPAVPPEPETSPAPVDKPSPEVCNLCGDPACSRKKGDPKVTCLHYGKYKEDE